MTQLTDRTLKLNPCQTPTHYLTRSIIPCIDTEHSIHFFNSLKKIQSYSTGDSINRVTMEYGRLRNGLRWSACSSASSSLTAVLIRDSFSGDEQCANSDNYLITFPDESDVDSVYDVEEQSSQELKKVNDAKLLDRCYENPLFVPAAEVLKGEISDGRDSEELMKSKARNFGDYKFCEAVNDFDIELETGEAVPIVYLSTTRAARLQRSLKLAGYKKVCFNLIFSVLFCSLLFYELIYFTVCH